LIRRDLTPAQRAKLVRSRRAVDLGFRVETEQEYKAYQIRMTVSGAKHSSIAHVSLVRSGSHLQGL
jgi:hypothetical protein